MAPIPGNSWTERRFGHAVARLRSNHALQGDARVTRVPSATIGLGAHERGRWTAPGI
jgi:hypothetical protein